MISLVISVHISLENTKQVKTLSEFVSLEAAACNVASCHDRIIL